MSDTIDEDESNTAEARLQSTSWPVFSPDNSEIVSLRHVLPGHLQEDHVDVLIINVEDDLRLALLLENAINELHFNVREGTIPARAVRLDNAVPFVRSKVNHLDVAHKFSTLTFAIVTQGFLENRVSQHTGNASFWETLVNTKKKNSFHPVYVDKRLPDDIPAMYRVLREIDMSTPEDQWKSRLRIIIEPKFEERLLRSDKQGQEARAYLASQNSQGSANSDAPTEYSVIREDLGGADSSVEMQVPCVQEIQEAAASSINATIDNPPSVCDNNDTSVCDNNDTNVCDNNDTNVCDNNDTSVYDDGGGVSCQSQDDLFLGGDFIIDKVETNILTVDRPSENNDIVSGEIRHMDILSNSVVDKENRKEISSCYGNNENREVIDSDGEEGVRGNGDDINRNVDNDVNIAHLKDGSCKDLLLSNTCSKISLLCSKISLPKFPKHRVVFAALFGTALAAIFGLYISRIFLLVVLTPVFVLAWVKRCTIRYLVYRAMAFLGRMLKWTTDHIQLW